MIFWNFLKGSKAEEKLKKVNKIINILLSLLDDKKSLHISYYKKQIIIFGSGKINLTSVIVIFSLINELTEPLKPVLPLKTPAFEEIL